MIEWLEASALNALLREYFAFVIGARVVHIIGITLLIGSSAVWDARLLGFGSGIPIRALERITLPIAQIGFTFAVLGGLILFTSSPVELARNPAFQLKLVLVSLAMLNSLIFHRVIARNLESWTVIPITARISAVASLALWVGTAVAGRLIGYV